MEKRVRLLCDILKEEAIGMAYAMRSSMLHTWKVKLANYSEYRELYNHVRFELRDVKMALDLREDSTILQVPTKDCMRQSK